MLGTDQLGRLWKRGYYKDLEEGQGVRDRAWVFHGANPFLATQALNGNAVSAHPSTDSVPAERNSSTISVLTAHPTQVNKYPTTPLQGPVQEQDTQFLLHDGGKDDDEETWWERFSSRPKYIAFNRLLDRILQSRVVAIALDCSDLALYVVDIVSDIRVCIAFHAAGRMTWFILTVVFITWHYVFTAVLICSYLKRSTQHYSILGIGDDMIKRGNYWWLAFVPVAIPGVVVLDLVMVVTTIAAVVYKEKALKFSSFLSNYNFTRLFMYFAMESVPQTILQSYVFFRTSFNTNLLNGESRTTIIISLIISAFNTIKFSWKIWKAASDAGLTLQEYSKYLLLLKGNYDVPPDVMLVNIQMCSNFADGVLHTNGFLLHRNKTQIGPAQQAYILLNSINHFEEEAVKRWVISGCPLPSMNRILIKGIKAFKELEALEVNECALRGDTLKDVVAAIKKRKTLKKVKLIQTGILKKYKNKRLDLLVQMFNPKLPLTQIALCVPWWDEVMMEAAAKQARLSPRLQSLAIDFPVVGGPLEDSLDAAAPTLEFLPVGSLYGWAVASILHATTPLESLYLHNHAFDEDALSTLCRALENNTRLTHLSLKGSAVGDSGAISVAKALKVNHVIKHVNLRLCQLHAEGVVALGAALVENRSLRFLDLSQNRVHHDGVKELARAMRLNNVLETLKMEDWHDTFMDPDAATALATAVSMNKGLQLLSLSGTPILTQGALQLGPALAQNSVLRLLDLGCSAREGAAQELRISDEGCASLGAALQSNSCLQELRLSGNCVSDMTTMALANALLGSTSLTKLDLSRCGLQAINVQDLADALAANKSLTSLKMTHVCSLDMGAMRALSNMLRANTPLKHLDMSCSQMTMDADVDNAMWSVLAQGLALNTSLQVLLLAYCGVSEAGAAGLAAALLQGTCRLTEMDLSGFSAAHARLAFAAVLQTNTVLKKLMVTGDNFVVVNLLTAGTTNQSQAQ